MKVLYFRKSSFLTCLLIWSIDIQYPGFSSIVGVVSQLLSNPNSQSLTSSNRAVVTTSGTVQGTEITFNGKTVKQYLGVPFAEPPVGELRFRKPRPVEQRNETIMADTWPAACLQYVAYPFPWYDFKDNKSEDCLYLNIWVPKSLLSQSEITKLPVMFWIYGGGFTVGSNRKPLYNGQALAAAGGIIVVTINYRMSVLGFLTSNTDAAPGNVGIYDQVEALKWVNRNIAAFGGDPDQVTIAGQSAGSISVGLLCVTPLTKGLFNQVIMESGSPAYLFGSNGTQNAMKSEKVAEAVGCANESFTIYDHPEEVVNCLRKVDAFELIKTESSFNPHSAGSFFPNYGNEIFPENARIALIQGNFHNAAVLIGDVHDEGSFQITTGNPEVFGFFGKKDEDPKVNYSYAASFINNSFSGYIDPDKVIQHYLGNLQDNDYERIRYQAYTAAGDFRLLCPNVFFADIYSEAGNDVFYFFFVHRPSTTPWAKWMGVAHFTEIQFVFGVPLQHPDHYTDEEVRLSRRMLRIWTNFVKYGNPGTDNWPKYSRENPIYVELSTGPKTNYGKGPHKDNCDFFRPYFGFGE